MAGVGGRGQFFYFPKLPELAEGKRGSQETTHLASRNNPPPKGPSSVELLAGMGTIIRTLHDVFC